MVEALPVQVAEQDDAAKGERKKKKRKEKADAILDKDGKPCRSCTSFRDWTMRMSSKAVTHTHPLGDDCPPDRDALGRASWTLLHAAAAAYPSTASPSQQSDMANFIASFSRVYPCPPCAAEFRAYLSRPENALSDQVLGGRVALGGWLCRAHNEVNGRLGKTLFDCSRWEERWRTGWKDGTCG